MKKIDREENFFSVVLLTQNNEMDIQRRIEEFDDFLGANFKNYEIIIVDNFSSDKTTDILKNINKKLTIIELSQRHNNQQALRAGLDICIGDFILEIEDISFNYDINNIMNMYHTCLEGNDFVFYSASKVNLSSKVFYRIINSYFKKKVEI